MRIVLVAGARPNFMKIAPLIHEMNKLDFCDYILVHTGQHYDYQMSRVFFEEFKIPEPNYFLNVGSGSHAVQTAKIMMEFERVCISELPEMVVVVGDVNSTLACALTAKKLNLKAAHVEAGLRSGDMTMPEEINRIVTDSISDYLFASEKSGITNLKKEGKSDEQIFFVGNVMIDTLFLQLEALKNSEINDTWHLEKKRYGVVTLHRPSNVDTKEVCSGIVDSLIEISTDMELIFPVHPRTRKNFEDFGLIGKIEKSRIRLKQPLSYSEFLRYWKDAAIVLTDSGGLQEETTVLGIPCFTLRDNTERPITAEIGTNIIVGNKKDSIMRAYGDFKAGILKTGTVPDLWDGKAAQRIVNILIDKL
ncbi:non-hydrolyzing UDP-N-acetylglucosamine 2-epimerase [Candidatus Magnetomonas plexicatena]|uniref:non-hydrolyzing UDP-N-acetylglucosamine 2-epimerase n=1 Tax=Candidatus Magnetomonas plexicatena TaxID=2552947 RepID=UPI001C78DC29|nr:UDP-N-acetylglucosamine 2-epimerase (non-hydrolyzing) [Nitrospirales bacterium LBB_01]